MASGTAHPKRAVARGATLRRSPLQREIQRLARELDAEAPPQQPGTDLSAARRRRVEELGRSVAGGSYEVDAHRVAEAILRRRPPR